MTLSRFPDRSYEVMLWRSLNPYDTRQVLKALFSETLRIEFVSHQERSRYIKPVDGKVINNNQ
jgi:hypothetical protein